MATGLKEISNLTGYSLSTVSRVLANKISGNSPSAKEILTVAREIGYSKYRDAAPSAQRILDIALMTQHFSEEFYAYLYASFDKICAEQNHSLTIHSLRYNKSIKEQLLYLSQNHDGFILFLPTLDTYGYDVIKKSLKGYPIISIAPVFEPVFDTFTFDSYQGGALAAKQFIESGVEKFGVIHGPSEKWEAELRKSGFYDTLEKESKKVSWSFKGDYSFESGEMAFHDIFDNKILSEDFSLYIHRPTATDESFAPKGCDSFYVLCPVPNLQGNINWTIEGDKLKDRIVNALDSTILPELKNNICDEFYMTPVDFKNDYRSTHGAGFSIAPNFSQSAWFRYHNKDPHIKNLFFAAAGAHPGAGIPGVLSSAKVVESLLK